MWTITMWAWVTRFNATFLRVEQLPEAVFAITGEATEMGYHPSEFQWECEESDFLDSLLDGRTGADNHGATQGNEESLGSPRMVDETPTKHWTTI
ncbi:hypothetical protein LCGC14_2873180, partial [marine sediment metagenome]